jgi:HK97 family phage portal protein
MSLIWGRKAEVRGAYQDVWGRGGDVGALDASSIESALCLVPVFASTRLIADQFAAAPLRVFRRNPDGSRTQLASQPPLVMSPSATVSAFTWKYQAITSVLLRGNAYGYETAHDSGGWPSAVEWMHPDLVSVDESGSSPAYFYLGHRLDPTRVVHVPGYAVAGSCVGISPLAAFLRTVETGLLAQDFGRDWFKNGAVPGGILKNTAQVIAPETAQAAAERFKVATRGRELFVTGADWDYSTLSVPADEARFIETLKLTATQIANAYGVPPERVGGETGSSMTYGNREQDTLDLVTFALRPWFVRFEEAISALLPRPQYAKFNLDAMLRADTLTRMQSHEIALRIGLETNDEAREIEDRAPLSAAEVQSWQDNYAKKAPEPVKPMPEPQRSDPVAVNVTSAPVEVTFQRGAFENTVDARTTVEPSIDATTHFADGAFVNQVDARTTVEPTSVEVTVPPAPPTRKRIETDEDGRITAVVEERDV